MTEPPEDIEAAEDGEDDSGDLVPAEGEQGLWGNRVRARIRVEQDALVSTSTIRPPTFTLVHVESAAT